MNGSSSSNSQGSFVPTTNVWDVSEIYEIDVNSDQFKELLVRLYQNLNIIALNVNIRDTGYYNTMEFINGQLFFPNPAYNSTTSPFITPVFRPVYRKVINFGALPDNSGGSGPVTTSKAHGIGPKAGWSFTRIYGCTTQNSLKDDDTGTLSALPIPYVSFNPQAQIQLDVDKTNVNITTGIIDYSAYTTTYVVLEYLKS